VLFSVDKRSNSKKISYMPTLNLKNITIKKMTDKNLNDYFLIVNNDNQEEAYFCFEWTVKDGWQELVNNWENLKEVEIDFIENERDFKVYRKVVSLWTNQGDIII
jgi:hypothetical protein